MVWHPDQCGVNQSHAMSTQPRRPGAIVPRVPRLVTPSLLLLVAASACGNEGRPPQRPESARGSAEHQPVLETPLLLVPRPRSMKTCEGALAVDRTTRIVTDGSPEARATGVHLAGWLGLERSSLEAREGTIELRLLDPPASLRDPAVEPPRTTEDESYTLDVSPARAVVEARSAAGLFFGAQTLAQLAGARRVGKETPPLGPPPAGWSIPCVSLDDAPRFPFRAMHLDVARHFFGKDVVARWIDLLAFYRFNVFHWHLTDDQGFRLEVKAHPELTAVGGQDGFYTHEDARQVVEHARTRHITVIPEVEMPGHTRALLAAHPELSCTGKKQPVPRTWGIFDDVLCAGNEKTYALLGTVLDEVASVFPSRIVHVGGDEVPNTRWSACPKCRAAMAKAGGGKPVDADALQAVFMQRIASMLGALGRRPMVWDEALSPRLPHDAIVLAWQSRERGHEAAEQSYDVVMAPHDHLYFNIRQSRAHGEPGHEGFLPWTKVYGFDPAGPALDAAKRPKILGGEGTLWTEYVETEEQIQTLVVPRIAALAEVLWSGASTTTDAQKDFAERLRAQRSMLDASGIRYFIEPPVGLRDRKVFLEGDAATVRIAPPLLFGDGTVRFTTDGSPPTAASPEFGAPFAVRETTTVAAALFLPNGRMSPVVRSTFVKERLRPPVTPGPDTSAQCTYFEGTYHRLPDVTKERPRARARVSGLSLEEIERAFAGKVRKEGFALVCDAFFDAPVDGVYRFVARADDGVRVSIDGEQVLEDDGEHEPRDTEGEIALARGRHGIHVAYFQGMEGKELTVSMEAPGAALTPLAPVMQRASSTR